MAVIASAPAPIRLAAHGLDALAARLRKSGPLQIPGVLAIDAAQRPYPHLRDRPQRALVTRLQGQHRAFDAAAMRALDHDKRAGFEELVGAEARAGSTTLCAPKSTLCCAATRFSIRCGESLAGRQSASPTGSSPATGAAIS